MTGIIETLVTAVLLAISPSNTPQTWFAEAGIPTALWSEFTAVAACESGLNPSNGEGDGGNAKGLFQIHWYLWQPWATRIDPRWEKAEWDDPVDNAALAYLIQEEYSIPRRADRWSQWTTKPHWPICQKRATELVDQ